MELAAVRVMNPNPRPLVVARGERVIAELQPKQEETFIVTSDLALSTPRGKSLVVLTGFGPWDDEEWVQEVGKVPVPPHPDRAVKEKPGAT